MLGIFCFSSSFWVYFSWKIKWKICYLQIGFQISAEHKFVYMLFYQKIINTLSPEFSSKLLFHIEYPLPPNPTMYMINKISYIWRLKISSSCWAPVTKSPSFNTYGNSESMLLDEAQEPEPELKKWDHD